MPRFAVSSNAFTRTTLEDAVRRAAAIGFEGVEVLADAPHAFPLPLPPERVARLRNAFLSAGARAASVNANTASGFFQDPPPEPVFEPSLASPNPEHRAWRVEFTRHAIDLAHALGAGSVSVTTGRPLARPERARETLVRSLLDVLPHAERRGVRVGIEYEPGLLVENARELVALLDEIDHPSLAANLDVTHAWVNGEDPVAVIRVLGPRIAHVHVADSRDRKHYHLVPGEGDIPWPRVLDALASVGYDGFVTLELYTCADTPDESAGAGLKHLQNSVALNAASG